jgi:acetyl esterase/lipase
MRGRWLALAAACVALLAGPDAAASSPAVPPAAAPVLPDVLTDIRYAGTSSAQGLDLYLPRSASGVPLVVLVHPGAFSEGDKREVGAVPTLLEQGYAVASVNYRLSSEARFPAAVQDVKAAIRWLRAHAGEHGIDPGRIAVWGTSAGGYLATMAGVSGGIWSGLDDVELGNAAVSSQVQAVVSWYGPGDFAAMDAQARQVPACAGRAPAHDDPGSPESRWLGGPVQAAPLVRASDPIAWLPSAPAGSLPRFLLVHGSADCTVPPGQSIQLGQALTAAGVPTQVEIVDGAGHAEDSLHQRMLGPTLDFIATALRHRTPG